MAFFSFGRKVEGARDFSLEEIPVFSSLTPAEQKIIQKKSRLIEFKRGDYVYEEGTDPDAFYIVITGRFRLFTKNRSGEEETLTYLYRNDHFGETSLLTGRPHSVTVEAKRDGMIMTISKEDFLKLVKEMPTISLHLSRSLGHRLTSTIQPGAKREVKISAIYSPSYSSLATNFCLDFAASLRSETQCPVIVVDFISKINPLLQDSLKRSSVSSFDFANMEPSQESALNACLLENPNGFHYIHAPINNEEHLEKDERKIATLITFLTYRFSYLILRLPPNITDLSFKALKRSDYVYVLSESDPKSMQDSASAIMEFQQGFGFSKSEIRVIAPDDPKALTIPTEEREAVLGAPIMSILPSKSAKLDAYNSTMRFLAKELAGSLVGLVLGSGAAYGLAHIGVLRVLEQEGISIDVIAGSSMGSLIGALWAAGYNANQLERIAKSIDKKNSFFKLVGIGDLSLPHHGLLKGKQVHRFLQSYIGNRTFQDLRIPVKIAAVDLFTSEEVILDTGRVVDAVRASISIPGIFRPYYHQNRFLIDGGVIDPLPVKALSGMGVKKIIGVNVLAGPGDRMQSNAIRNEKRRRVLESQKRKGILGRLQAGANKQVHERYAGNIFNVIMSTVQFMEYEIANTSSQQADVLIHPTLSEGHWAEFYSSAKFIKMGEEKTREVLADIKRLVQE